MHLSIFIKTSKPTETQNRADRIEIETLLEKNLTLSKCLKFLR